MLPLLPSSTMALSSLGVALLKVVTAVCEDRLNNAQQIQSSFEAFAALLNDGSVVTWGDAHGGGDSSAVQEQLKNVQKLQSNGDAFAAILNDGSVITCGGNSAVQNKLKSAWQIHATSAAFAAMLNDGFVVTCGDAYCGRDSSAVQDQLTNVRHIRATIAARPLLL